MGPEVPGSNPGGAAGMMWHMDDSRPVLLDLFCGGGGASFGYQQAGFRVVGVDWWEQPDYPCELVCGDVFEVAEDLTEALRPVLIHASPPCQASSRTRSLRRGSWTTPEPVNQVAQTRELLESLEAPWVMEQVSWRLSGLRPDLMLCGRMFDLDVVRHRWFEFGGVPVVRQLEHPRHGSRVQRAGDMPTVDRPVMTITGRTGHRSAAWLTAASKALGVPWLDGYLAAVCEAIPPAYTRFIGTELLR